MKTDTLLLAIGSTNPVAFGRFCHCLGKDRPARVDPEATADEQRATRRAWRELFEALEAAEKEGLLFIERAEDGTIEQLVLSKEGADRARGLLDQERGLLVIAEGEA